MEESFPPLLEGDIDFILPPEFIDSLLSEGGAILNEQEFAQPQCYEISLLDPFFESPILVAGIGRECEHWQPFCLIMHWRRFSNRKNGTSSYACPVDGCGKSINFDYVSVMEDVTRQAQEGNVTRIQLFERPLTKEVKMIPIISTAAKCSGSREPSVVEPEDSVEPVEDEEVCGFKHDLKRAMEHAPGEWRKLYRAKRDELKKRRRKVLRLKEQLDHVTTEGATLKRELSLRVSKIESRMQKCPEAFAKRFYVDKGLFSECIAAIRRKKAQIDTAIEREKEIRQHSDDRLQASYDRRLLQLLWEKFISFTVLHFVPRDTANQAPKPKIQKKKKAAIVKKKSKQ